MVLSVFPTESFSVVLGIDRLEETATHVPHCLACCWEAIPLLATPVTQNSSLLGANGDRGTAQPTAEQPGGVEMAWHWVPTSPSAFCSMTPRGGKKKDPY